MSRLATLQSDFQSFLLGDATPLDAHVVGTDRVPVGTRLGIYSNAYLARLIEALKSTYPVLAELLGAAEFAELGEAYVRAWPSRFSSIRYYGDTLPDFLAAHPDYEAAPVLAELARWEWTMTEVFDAADADRLSPESLSQVPPEEWAELRLHAHPSVRRVTLAWNAPQIWKAITQQAERSKADLQPEPVSWLLWRRELQILFRALAPAEAAALDALRAGKSFGELCVALCDHCEEQQAPAQAAAFLGEWIRSGVIARALPFPA